MLAHYSHVRLEAERNALEAISSKRTDQTSGKGKSEGYDTNHDTNPPKEPMSVSVGLTPF